jgi:hypothetical protein
MGKWLAKCQVIEITLLIENPVRFAAVVEQPPLVYFNHWAKPGGTERAGADLCTRFAPSDKRKSMKIKA